jgi:pyruvate formate lyase activating enzyme
LIFKGWQKTSLIEYPGKIATVLFTGGCNFRCPFCYNVDLVLRPQTLPNLDGELVLEFLRENRHLYQALVVTGGEPTLHAKLPAFLGKAKEMDLSIGLETNGTNPEMLGSLLREALVDYVAMDVKAPLSWSSYRRAAGLAEHSSDLLERVRESLSLLDCATVEVELRCTVLPPIHSREDLLELARQLQGYRRFVLQQFVPDTTLDGDYTKVEPFSRETLEQIVEEISSRFSSCEIRGI